MLEENHFLYLTEGLLIFSKNQWEHQCSWHIIESDSDDDYEIFDDVEIEEGDVIIELGLPEIDTGFVPSESESEAESTDSEDDIPLVNLNKRKMKPIIRSNLKKARGN